MLILFLVVWEKKRKKKRKHKKGIIKKTKKEKNRKKKGNKKTKKRKKNNNNNVMAGATIAYISKYEYWLTCCRRWMAFWMCSSVCRSMPPLRPERDLDILRSDTFLSAVSSWPAATRLSTKINTHTKKNRKISA